jgi:hypothetical protein
LGGGLRPEVGGPDHGPGTDLEVVEPGVDERGNPLLRARAVGHPVRQGVPEERRHVVLGIAKHRLAVDRDIAVAVPQDVVVVEVAVDQRRASDLEAVEQLTCERHELAALIPVALARVEPAGNDVADPAERRRRGTPQPARDVDSRGDGLRFRQHGEIRSRPRAFLQQRPTRRVAAEEANRTVAVPDDERLGFVQRLVVTRPGDLQHHLGTHRRDVRVPGERERLAELEAPVGGDRVGDRLQLFAVRQLVHAGRR